MAFEVHISYEVEPDMWNKALLENKNSLTYQTHNWQIVFQQVYDSKPFFIYVSNNSGCIVGQLAGVIHKKWLWRRTRPGCLQARRHGRDRRLCRLRLRISRVRGPSGDRRRSGVGAGTGHRLFLGALSHANHRYGHDRASGGQRRPASASGYD